MFGWNIFTQQALYKAYDKRCSEHPVDKEQYEKVKKLGTPYEDGKPTEEALNKLAADVSKQIDRRKKFSRCRIPVEGEIVTYVNDRNKVYNNKLERVFGKFAQNTKIALEMANQKDLK